MLTTSSYLSRLILDFQALKSYKNTIYKKSGPRNCSITREKFLGGLGVGRGQAQPRMFLEGVNFTLVLSGSVRILPVFMS